MEHYNARVELETRDEGTADDLIDALVGYSPAVARSARGWIEVYFTLPADSLRQAATSALGVIESAWPTAGVVAIEVLTTAEFDARLGIDFPMPDLFSVTQAAEYLGLSRQRVLQMITEGKLAHVTVGNTYALPKVAVEEWHARNQRDFHAAAADLTAQHVPDVSTL